MNDVTFTVLKVVLSIACALITYYVVPLLKRWIQNNKDTELMKIVKIAVKAAEQTIRGEGKGPIRKEDVLEFIHEWLKEHNVEISEKQLDQLIEAMVYDMNHKTEESDD